MSNQESHNDLSKMYYDQFLEHIWNPVTCNVEPDVEMRAHAHYYRDKKYNVEFTEEEVKFDIEKLGLDKTLEDYIKIYQKMKLNEIHDLLETGELDFNKSIGEYLQVPEDKLLKYHDKVEKNQELIEKIYNKLENHDHVGYYKLFSWDKLLSLGW